MKHEIVWVWIVWAVEGGEVKLYDLKITDYEPPKDSRRSVLWSAKNTEHSFVYDQVFRVEVEKRGLEILFSRIPGYSYRKLLLADCLFDKEKE